MDRSARKKYMNEMEIIKINPVRNPPARNKISVKGISSLV
jgi:hypothetical protein